MWTFHQYDERQQRDGAGMKHPTSYNDDDDDADDDGGVVERYVTM